MDRQRPGVPLDRSTSIALILGSALNPINTTTMAVALTPIGAAFNAPPSQTVWLITLMYLGTAIGQPIAGRLVDIFGARHTYLWAAAIVGVAGTVAALAPTLPVLIASRVAMGLGTSAAYPAAMSVIRRSAEGNGSPRQAMVLTALAISNQSLAAVGPVIGGLLLGGSWRMIFAINVPLAVACLVLGSLKLQNEERGSSALWLRRMDVRGVACFCVSLVGLLLCVIEPAEVWLVALPVAVSAAALLVRFEWDRRDPFIDVRIVTRNRPLVWTFVRQAASLGVSFCYVYGITQWLADQRGLEPTATGLAVTPLFATSIVVSGLLRHSSAVLSRLLGGALASGSACLLIVTLEPTSPFVVVIAVAVLLGVAQGLNAPALQMSVLKQSEPHRIGASAGLLRTSGYVGGMVSSGAIAACFSRSANSTGLHHLGLFMCGLSVILLIVTVADKSLRPPIAPKPSGA